MNFKPTELKSLFARQLLWCAFAITLLVFSLGISWQASKEANFLYGFWYQTLEINNVISRNVPKNSQGKRDFPINDRELHEEKFAEIVTAIHQHGHGLTDIGYINNQAQSKKLLTTSEVQHLQDVANLLDSVSRFWWINLLFLIGLSSIYCRKPKVVTNTEQQILVKHQPLSAVSISTMPTGQQKLAALVTVIILIIALLGLWGFTQVFYYLHTVVFPADHQWFFYYKDSLMASLMKAPDIFAAIAAQLLVVALLIAGGIDRFITHLQRKFFTVA
ncbi:DUF1461 domain-containing protein [Colwellia sp. Arc7-635]|uniref:lipoprotein intramolecular transacylase Lit n=1 Tax=Colwellia sp. Arc7-635 TaxID=2497879 RepID=UPI000F857D3E|nr:DUF1461 domain-containing protein [Colwellia sp. Arc7-635]AZQ84228.1 DUF1461 domain-containing protein [Colwellia sp. Arc7-635]